MKILLDEQLEGMLEYLQSFDYEVTTVKQEKMEGAKDYKVVQFAKDNGYVLVTQDQKPAQIARLHNVPHVWISFDKQAQIVLNELEELLSRS